MPHSRTRSIRLLAASAALAAVAVLTLAPRWLVAPARSEFMRWVDAAAPPLLVWIPYGASSERVLNTLLFLPIGATLALILSRRVWPLAVVAGFALSATVEYAQAAIPGRVPDPADVGWNTLGAAIGVVVAASVRGLTALARRRGGRAMATTRE
jgi:hypothetical protein